MGKNMIEGGGRRHGFQILKERAGSSGGDRYTLNISQLF